jgi:hypothetical protein
MTQPVNRLPEIRPLHQFFGGQRIKQKKVSLIPQGRLES